MASEEFEDGKDSRDVITDLKDLYLQRILPVEQTTDFGRFGYGELNEGDFTSNPIALLIGPYSAGKTTFIQHLVGRDFPGQRVGPEPTTDRFVAIMSGDEDRVIPGNALTVTPGTAFNGLEKFGNNFLTRFEGSQVTGSKLLESLTIIDTPGVLSGEKQTKNRSYNYTEVLDWFAERSDCIILVFDVQKLDITDEMGAVVKSLQRHYDKIRVVLNKADTISHQNLLRVYGAFLWGLGRVITTPEVTRVYIGSFWDRPLANKETEALMTKEMKDLMKDLSQIPRMSAVRKINDIVTRIRQLRIHVFLLDHIRSLMPSVFGKDKKKKEILNNLGSVFRTVMKENSLTVGDFPDLESFKSSIDTMDLSKLPKIKGDRMKKGQRLIDLNKSLKIEIPQFLSRLPGIARNRSMVIKNDDLLDENNLN